MNIYLAIISYPYEGGAVIGVYGTQEAAQDAVQGYAGAQGFDRIVAHWVLDAQQEPVNV